MYRYVSYFISAQRQPPTYTPPSILRQVMRPTNNRMTPDQPPPIIPLGQPVLDRDGQPIQIQHGTITRSTTGEAAPTLVPVVIGIQMGPSAATMSCPSCQEEITTKTVLKSNTSTLTLAALFGCFW